MPTSYKATALLAICVLGAIGAILCQARGGGFWAGLLAHGFLAATIGGLADWFAVTAIFRRPLGIGWRTDVLRRNRARITKELVDFTSGDLLSRENIMNTLANEDFAQMLITYLTKRGGTERLTGLAEAFVRQVIANIDITRLCASLTPSIREILGSIDISPLIDAGAETLRSRIEPKQLIQAFLPSLRQLIAGPMVQNLLLSHIVAIREAYEGQSLKRSAFFTLLGLSDEKLLSLCNEKIADGLSQLERGEGPLWEQVQAWLHHQLASNQKNKDWHRWIEEWKKYELRQIDLTDEVQRYWEAYRNKDQEDWLRKTRALIEGYVQRFAQEKVWQRRVNQYLLQFFSNMVDRHHEQIPQLIMAHVGRLSDDDLVELAESKVADDLQMVRVNGSVVGAVTGMILYLCIYMVGRLGS